VKHTTALCKSSRFRCLEDLQKESVELCLTYCGYEECDAGHRFGPNRRTSYVLHIVMAGKGTLETGNKKLELHKGDAFLIIPDTEAYYQADWENPWSYMWVGFTGLKAEECSVHAGLSLKNPARRIECVDACYHYIEQMIDAHQLSFADELKRNGLLMLFFSELINDYRLQEPNAALAKPYPGSVYVKYAMEYISHNYDKRIKINELADDIGVNRSYLTSSFKKAMGCSPQEYLVNLRMEKAKSLLKRTDLPINSVAQAVGYGDQLAFSKIFKQYYGMSPRAFRNQEEELLIYENKDDFSSSDI
jgi:AraC-like DNA-binding protein